MSDLPNRRPPQPPPLVRAAVDEDRWRRQLIDSITDLQAAVQLVSERVDRIADATLTRVVGRQLIGWDAPMTSSPGEEPALPNMPDAVRSKLNVAGLPDPPPPPPDDEPEPWALNALAQAALKKVGYSVSDLSKSTTSGDMPNLTSHMSPIEPIQQDVVNDPPSPAQARRARASFLASGPDGSDSAQEESDLDAADVQHEAAEVAEPSDLDVHEQQDPGTL